MGSSKSLYNFFPMSSDDETKHDAIDLLLAQSRPDDSETRVLDFVRKKVRALQSEKKELQSRVRDLEHTLEIVQTAQAWSLSNTVSHEQAARMKDVTSLLLQAKKARQEALNFSKVGKGALFEKLRVYKGMLQRERQEKAQMRERLAQAFEQAKYLRDQNRSFEERRKKERDLWQRMVRELRDKQHRELEKLKQDLGEYDVQKHERLRQLGNFGEKVMGELQALQEHLSYVRAETIDSVDAAGGASGPGDEGDFFITQ